MIGFTFYIVFGAQNYILVLISGLLKEMCTTKGLKAYKGDDDDLIIFLIKDRTAMLSQRPIILNPVRSGSRTNTLAYFTRAMR